MGKKSNVNLNSAPLEAVVVGKVKKNRFGFIGVIILFALFGGIIYYLPELEMYYEKYILHKVETTVDEPLPKEEEIPKKEEETPQEQEKTELKALDSTLTIEYENLLYSNFTNENNFAFTIINNHENDITLDHIFVELYDENKAMVKRLMIPGTIKAYSNLQMSFEKVVNLSYIAIKKINEEDYTYLTLDLDNENKSHLTCKNNSEEIVYTFFNEKLENVNYKVSYLKTDSSYSQMKDKYNTLVLTYSNVSGITSSLTETSDSIIYNINIDYNITSLDLNNPYYYNKSATARKINYEMSAMQFTCN